MELVSVVLKATWSLEEGAQLVHAVNPVTKSVELSDQSNDPVNRTYIWLLKEHQRGRLQRVKGDQENPLFSPGTIMRHLQTHQHYVSDEVERIYHAGHGRREPSQLRGGAKKVYLCAAELVWKDHPNMPASRVAEHLAELPRAFTKNRLDWFATSTIRKWLHGKGPGKAGRPPSTSEGFADPDLGKIAEKLDEN